MKVNEISEETLKNMKFQKIKKFMMNIYIYLLLF